MLRRYVLTVVVRGFVGQVNRRGGGLALARGRDDAAAAGAALDHVVATGDQEVAGRHWWRRRRRRRWWCWRRRGRRRRRRRRRGRQRIRRRRCGRRRGRRGRRRAGSLADVLVSDSAWQVVPLARVCAPIIIEHQAVLFKAEKVGVIRLVSFPVGIRQRRVGRAPHPRALGCGISAANPHLVVTRNGEQQLVLLCGLHARQLQACRLTGSVGIVPRKGVAYERVGTGRCGWRQRRGGRRRRRRGRWRRVLDVAGGVVVPLRRGERQKATNHLVEIWQSRGVVNVAVGVGNLP